jgi:hypothetical protein
MRTREDPCARSLCHLLHLEAAGRRIFWWPARAGPRARRLLLPCLRSFGATQTLHRCSSSRTRKILTPSYDFALPWVSREKWVAQESFIHRCHRFCSNCGANNTRSAMSKPHWISRSNFQQLRACLCSEESPLRKPARCSWAIGFGEEF